MSLSELLLMNVYILSVFALVVKPKASHQAYRVFKVMILALSVLFARELFVSGPINGEWLHTAFFVFPLIWILAFFLHGELVSLLKTLGMKTGLFPSNVIEEEVKYELMDSIDYLSRHKIGAIITFERANSLEEFINSAFLLGAPLSSELLSSIFYPNTPLHDGAVIIKENTIMCGGAYFPPSDNPKIPKNLGSRHRAAIGISEITDAFTVVVSEQTGQISVTVDGYLDQDISAESLELYLEKYLQA